MNLALPDVSLTEISSTPGPLRWVGMQDIALPVLIVERGYRRALAARADVQVDLPLAEVKGIHMSRLYRELDAVGEEQPLSPARLKRLLHELVASQHDCGSRAARLQLSFELLLRRPALRTEGLAGWKHYPVRLLATLAEDVSTLRAQVEVGYSSTCPCSAALARQLVEQGFSSAFSRATTLAPEEVANWLREHATLATPHSQRSLARVSVDVPEGSASLSLLALIDRVEQAVATPVQTAVKRADEQAFAALNGQNLMFVEDAARRINAAMQQGFHAADVHVRHLESLHPHDAVAWAGTASTDWPTR